MNEASQMVLSAAFTLHCDLFNGLISCLFDYLGAWHGASFVLKEILIRSERIRFYILRVVKGNYDLAKSSSRPITTAIRSFS